MDQLAALRPKLKQDSIFLETRDGVFLRSDASTFMLKGKSVYRMLATLSPYMNGEHTLDELCQGLDPSQQQAIARLVDTLLQRGVLKNHIPEAPDLLPGSVCRQFRAQIEMIDHYVDRPVERFKAFRESRILLLGAGETFHALALSLLRNGLQELILAPFDDIEHYLPDMEKEQETLRLNGVETRLTQVTLASRQHVEGLGSYDMVVYCADDSSLKDVLSMQQNCLSQGQKFLPAIVFGEQAILGPLVQPEQGPCWLCAQMRIASHAAGELSAAIWRALIIGSDLSAWNTPLFTPQARNIGNGLAFELFKFFTGCLTPETQAGLIFQNLENLESYHSRLIQHPLCPVCSCTGSETALRQLHDVVEGKHDKEVEIGEELLRHLDLLVDQRAGVFHQFADETIMQLPLKISRITVSAPASPLAPGFEVTACNAETLLEARLSAMSEAVSRYVRGLPDERAMIVASHAEMERRGLRTVMPAQLETWSGVKSLDERARRAWFPTLSLFDRHIYYVPAAAIYPSSRLNQEGMFENTPAGVATHTNMQDLLTAGTASALAYAHMRGVMQQENALIRLDVGALEEVDTNLTFLLRNAHHLERPFALLEVVTGSPLHVMLAHTTDALAERVTATGWGLSGVEAASKTLLHLVGKLQLLKYEGKVSAFSDDLFPEFLSRTVLLFADDQTSRFNEAASTLDALQDFLRASGRTPLFAHTTTADIWEANLFISGTLLLARL